MMTQQNERPSYAKSSKIETFEEFIRESKLNNKATIWRRTAEWILVILLFFIMYNVGIAFKLDKAKHQLAEQQETIEKLERELIEVRQHNDFVAEVTKPITGSSLVELIEQMNIQHPKIVVAQAIIESGHFKSKLFQINHNLFGMRKAYQRPTTRIPADIDFYFESYAYYHNWQYSVFDYALWQSSFARNLSETEYLDLLKRTYAEDEEYISKIKKIISGCDSAQDIIIKYDL